MASDSLQKPQQVQQRGLIESFHLSRIKLSLLLQNQGLVPKTWWPWHTIPILFYVVLTLMWFTISSLCEFVGLFCVAAPISLIWKYIILPALALVWIHVLPSSLKAYLREVNWAHVGFKLFSRTLLAIYALMVIGLFYSSPWELGGGSPDPPKDGLQYPNPDLESYFNSFAGSNLCNLRASDLYNPPVSTDQTKDKNRAYCSTRFALLTALSHGGRHGFDAPYAPYGCAYRWYSVPEICAILSRFDAIIFLGDDTLATIYGGLSILLRRDLQHGALSLAPKTPPNKMRTCECDSQFSDASCHEYYVHDSSEVIERSEGSTYACQLRPPHALLQISSAPAPTEVVAKFNRLVRSGPRSSYRPIPIIHSVTGAVSSNLAMASISEFLALADASGRKTPMLWIGPPAAGHLDIKGRKGNEEIWRFAIEMTDFATKKDVESLGLWNLTVQANSYDGVGFGEGVGIVGAMMVVNWLARLESS